MGCGESRARPSEERAILISEAPLGFGFNEALNVDMCIRKYSTNNTINPSQLQKIAKTLRLNLNDLPGHSKITEFFNKLMGEGGIPLKDFLVIGILLSIGTPAVKARLLFQVFDEQSSEQIPVEQLRNELFSSIIKQSVKLGTLVANGENPYSNELKTTKYTQDLLQVTGKAVNNLMEKLVQKENSYVTETNFIQVMSRIVDGNLVFASGWRCYLNEIFVSDPPKPAFVNPFLKRTPQIAEPTE